MLKNILTSRRVCSKSILPLVVPITSSPPFKQISRGLRGVVIGENVDGGAPRNFRTSRVGQVIENPYEVTVDAGWLAVWQSQFFHHERLTTSDVFAKDLDFKGGRILPFSFINFQTASMSHVDELTDVMELGIYDAVYVRPVYCGDTVKKQFTLKRMQPTSDGERTIVTYKCELFNQRKQLCFTCDKVMLYPYPTSAQQKSVEPKVRSSPARSFIKDHLTSDSTSMPQSATLAKFEPGTVLLHTYLKSNGTSPSIALNTLFKQAHPLLVNLYRHTEKELVLPGPIVLAMTLSASSRVLFEVLHEQVESCRFLNQVHPTDTVGAITYVKNVTPLPNGLEELDIVTVGLRATDPLMELRDLDLPIQLFEGIENSKDFAEFIDQNVPILSEKVACQIVRKVVRQSPFNDDDVNVPLL